MTNGIVLSVLAAVAKQERITLSERTKAGLQRARRTGNVLGVGLWRRMSGPLTDYRSRVWAYGVLQRSWASVSTRYRKGSR
jgi:DNA invertase Pin-like site-specific DNA recombinase